MVMGADDGKETRRCLACCRYHLVPVTNRIWNNCGAIVATNGLEELVKSRAVGTADY